MISRLITISLIFFTSIAIGQKKDLGLQFFLQEEELIGGLHFYDYNKKMFYVSGKEDFKLTKLPGETFNIFNSLLFLKLEVVSDTSEVLEWKGKESTLSGAFKSESDWFFEYMSDGIPYKKYKENIKRNNYSRYRKYGTKPLSFWSTGEMLMTSPFHQIRFLRRLFADKLGFSKNDQKKVRDMMIEKATDDFTLYGIEGLAENYTCKFCKNIRIGWYVGVLITADNKYYFAVRLQEEKYKDLERFKKLRKQITYKAIKHLFKIDLEK